MHGASNDKTLFVIPDIGGFTKFVTQTEASHSQHIIKELLEILVDANTMGLKVSEFEGSRQVHRKGRIVAHRLLKNSVKEVKDGFEKSLRNLARLCEGGGQ